jgi:hypothetical protein
VLNWTQTGNQFTEQKSLYPINIALPDNTELGHCARSGWIGKTSSFWINIENDES